MKTILELGQVLTKKEMKELKGGTGTCCAHSADWTFFECDISRSEAISWGIKWCCDSCPPIP